MTASGQIAPTELEAYEALQYYTLSHGRPEFIHQYAVDAWAAQHADSQTRPLGLAFALVGLCLHIERGFSGRQVQRVHMALAQRKQHWPSFSLPEQRGSKTACDVMAAPAGLQRDQALDAWCASVWSAFGECHQEVAELLARYGFE